MFWIVQYLQIHNLKNLKSFFKKNKEIDCTFDISSSLKDRIEAIREEAETQLEKAARVSFFRQKYLSKKLAYQVY